MTLTSRQSSQPALAPTPSVVQIRTQDLLSDVVGEHRRKGARRAPGGHRARRTSVDRRRRDARKDAASQGFAGALVAAIPLPSAGSRPTLGGRTGRHGTLDGAHAHRAAATGQQLLHYHRIALSLDLKERLRRRPIVRGQPTRGPPNLHTGHGAAPGAPHRLRAMPSSAAIAFIPQPRCQLPNRGYDLAFDHRYLRTRR